MTWRNSWGDPPPRPHKHEKLAFAAFIVAFIVFLLLGSEAQALTLTGGDSSGRYQTVRNVVNEYPAVAAALPATLEVRLLYWGYSGAKTSKQADGHIRIDIDGRLWNPAFSGLVAHELGHVLEIDRAPGFIAAWNQVETAHGFGSSLWRYYPQTDWWWWNPSEGFAENFRRGLFWPYYSDLSTPRTYLTWLSRVELKAFLTGRGI